MSDIGLSPPTLLKPPWLIHYKANTCPTPFISCWELTSVHFINCLLFFHYECTHYWYEIVLCSEGTFSIITYSVGLPTNSLHLFILQITFAISLNPNWLKIFPYVVGHWIIQSNWRTDDFLEVVCKRWWANTDLLCLCVLEPCLNVQLKDVLKKKYKNCRYTKHQGHTEWVRQGETYAIFTYYHSLLLQHKDFIDLFEGDVVSSTIFQWYIVIARGLLWNQIVLQKAL